MMPLIYFVLGILFIRCVLPLCEQLISWAVLAIERKKTKIAVRTTKLEKRIEEIVNELVEVTLLTKEGNKYITNFPIITKEYDIIFLDAMMPGMDGFTFCKNIRQEKNVPIILEKAGLAI